MSIFKSYDIRGIYPSQINEGIVEKIGKAFVTYLSAKKVVVGYDMRTHSKPLFDALANGIVSAGADVINIGLCSTPIAYFANGTLQADGSLMITASHNPGEWNGLKLCRDRAIPISGETGIKDIEKIVFSSKWKTAATKGVIKEHDISEAYGKHIRSFSKLTKKLKVVVDFGNAMGSMEIKGIRDLFEIIPLYEELDGSFPNHEANPLIAETLHDLRRKVKVTGADFGAAFDGDADRCGFIDNGGEIIPMDIITAIIAEDILKDGHQTILYDLRSSRAVKECIEANGGKAVMCRVGHSFIKAQMRETNAAFAGELSGHYYFRENFVAESQALAFLKFANLICTTGKTASELIAPLEKYYSAGEINSEVKDVKNVLNKLKQKYSDGKILELDGLSVEYDDWWFNVRPSNTEPLLRLNLEASTKTKMEEKRDELLALIREDS
jgi:phosphomannomutase